MREPNVVEAVPVVRSSRKEDGRIFIYLDDAGCTGGTVLTVMESAPKSTFVLTSLRSFLKTDMGQRMARNLINKYAKPIPPAKEEEGDE